MAKKHPKKKARYIFPEERERIIKCRIGTRYEKRNIAICQVGFTIGFRVSEICNLRLYNVFNDKWELLENCRLNPEQSKGGYSGGEFFIVSKATRKSIIDYIEERRAHAHSIRKELSLQEPLFISQKGKNRNKPFDYCAMGNLIAFMFLKSGVTPNDTCRISSHCMRRTFATDFSYKHPHPKQLQVLLRHKTPSQSIEYVETNSEQLKGALKDVFK